MSGSDSGDAGRGDGTDTASVALNLRTRGVHLPIVAFVVSRAIFYLAGGSFDLSPLGPTVSGSVAWQVLNPHLLRSDLVDSLWYLHSQSPLFNAFCGLLVHLPTAMRQTAAALVYLALGLLLVPSAYLTMVALRVPRWLAVGVGLLIVIDPSYVLSENWLFYAYPTAATLSLASLCCVRYLQTRRTSWGVGLCATLSAVVKLNSTYQIVWLLVLLALVLVASIGQWRSAVKVAIVPLLVVSGWYLKDALVFDTFTTSSWFGMNLANSTVAQAPPGVVASLEKRGTLDSLAELAPFRPLSFYVPRFASAPHTGRPVLDNRFKAVPAHTSPLFRDANTNYNNLAYIDISRRYFDDDVAFIRAEPGRYAATVAKAGSLWFVPSDQYEFLRSNRAHFGTWARLYDRAVLWQPRIDQFPQGLTTRGLGPSPSQVSYETVLIFALPVLGGPLAFWLRRRYDRPGAFTLAVIWSTVVYALVVTSLFEFGENERFRFELGPLPVVLGAAVIGSFIEVSNRRNLVTSPRSDDGPDGPRGTG